MGMGMVIGMERGGVEVGIVMGIGMGMGIGTSMKMVSYPASAEQNDPIRNERAVTKANVKEPTAAECESRMK